MRFGASRRANGEAVATIKAKAQGHAENLMAIVADVRIKALPASDKLPTRSTAATFSRRAVGGVHATSNVVDVPHATP